MSDEIAVYCLDGHYIGTMPDDHYRGFSPGRLQQMLEKEYIREVEGLNHCERCGQPSIIACPSCNAYILDRMKRPDYCRVCGKPFPWTRTAQSDTPTDGDVFGPLER